MYVTRSHQWPCWAGDWLSEGRNAVAAFHTIDFVQICLQCTSIPSTKGHTICCCRCCEKIYKTKKTQTQITRTQKRRKEAEKQQRAVRRVEKSAH